MATTTVKLRYNDGTLWRTVSVTEGSYFLPMMTNPIGYTFIGWANSKGKTISSSSPWNSSSGWTLNEAGSSISTSGGTIDLYAVLMKRDTTNEPDIGESSIADTASAISAPMTKYKGIIFVGDSRVGYIKSSLQDLITAGKINKSYFVYKGGAGLSNWLDGEGYTELLNVINNTVKPTAGLKAAVIFCFGVNDLGSSAENAKTNADLYVSYLNSKASELTNKNCVLHCATVGPVNENLIVQSFLPKYRTARQVRTFNGRLSGLSSSYTQLGLYTYLKNYGYSTCAAVTGSTPRNVPYDDGLHYSKETSKRIYSWLLRGLA